VLNKQVGVVVREHKSGSVDVRGQDHDDIVRADTTKKSRVHRPSTGTSKPVPEQMSDCDYGTVESEEEEHGVGEKEDDGGFRFRRTTHMITILDSVTRVKLIFTSMSQRLGTVHQSVERNVSNIQ
jgi:hypothetical protein